jgi:hypothetical protein
MATKMLPPNLFFPSKDIYKAIQALERLRSASAQHGDDAMHQWSNDIMDEMNRCLNTQGRINKLKCMHDLHASFMKFYAIFHTLYQIHMDT